MAEPNPFDKAARGLLKRVAAPLVAWLLRLRGAGWRFAGWLDARLVTFPGEPDRTCDTVAELADEGRGGVPWAVPVEVQMEPDARLRAEYGALAVVFAEAARCRDVWKASLEAWNVIESITVREWEEQGARKFAVGQVLRILQTRFTQIPQPLEAAIRAASLPQLEGWLMPAATAASLDEFRRQSGL